MNGSEIIKQQPVMAPDTDNRLKQWMFERIKPLVTGRVLEIAGEKGWIAPICEQQGISVDVKHINLDDVNFETKYIDLFNVFDTVIAFNQSTEAEGNIGSIEKSGRLLKTGGHLFIQLPAHTALYKGLDQGLERWNTYNWRYINTMIMDTDYEIIKVRYFIIGDNPPLFQQSNKYMERDTIFSKSNAIIFNQAGLFILIACKKR